MRSRRLISYCGLVLLLWLSVSPSLPGQVGQTATISIQTEVAAVVSWQGVRLGRADTEGLLSVTGVPRGKFVVEVSKPGFQTEQVTLDIANANGPFKIPLKPIDVAAGESDLDWKSPDDAALLLAVDEMPAVIAEGADPGMPKPELVVRRGEFRKRMALTGQLTTRNSTNVSVPRIDSLWSFLITELAPEGSFVNRGDLLVRFDITELAQQARELEKQREDSLIQIAQQKAEQDARLQDLRLAVATARKNRETAALYVGIDRSLIAASEADQYSFDYERAAVELAKAEERLAQHGPASAAQLAETELEFERTEIELDRLRADMERMTIRAPFEGLVIHGLNNDNQKNQVGDSLFKGNQVLVLPDMSTLLVRANAFDRDFARVHVDAPATIIFDAFPQRRFPGRVVQLAEAAKPVRRRSELEVFHVDVQLLDRDLSVMKPGMTARVVIETTTEDAVIVPREAVSLHPDGTSTVQLAQNPSQAVPVTIVDANSFEMVVEGNLNVGDRLLNQNLAQQVSGPQEIDWITVQEEDVRFTVSASGVLKAAESVAIMPPTLPDTFRYKIVQMAPEGEGVSIGDPLVAFDPTKQIQQFQQEEANLKKVKEELDKVRASQTLSESDLELELEEAEVELEKAANKLGTSRQFDSGLAIREAELEAELARTRVDLLTRKLASIREHSRLQNQILKETAKLHETRILAAQEALQKMRIPAPRSGVVIYRRNWRNEKKEVGSDAHLGEVILTIPNLESLIVEGQVSEVDAGKLQIGQTVDVSLDAIPEKTLPGRIIEIGRIFSQPSSDRPIRVLDIVVELGEVDPQRMRPEMVARLDVIIDQYRDVLALPLSVIQVEEDRSYVWVDSGTSPEKREVEVGESNGVVAIISAGLQSGERVASNASGLIGEGTE